MCFGPSGAISKVEGGVPTRVVEGLASGITDTGETLGPSGVVVASDGTIWFTVGGPGVGAADLRATITGGEGIGQLYKAGADGTATSVADLAAFEVANNPDKDQPGNETPDSNVNGLAIAADGSVLVADAGGNDLLSVASRRHHQQVTVFPWCSTRCRRTGRIHGSRGVGGSNASPMIPIESGAHVGGRRRGWHDLRRSAHGLSRSRRAGERVHRRSRPGPGAVREWVHQRHRRRIGAGRHAVRGRDLPRRPASRSSEARCPSGGLWKVPAGGGTPELITDALPMLGGVAVGADGTVYVSTCAMCQGGGGIASYTPASEPGRPAAGDTGGRDVDRRRAGRERPALRAIAR